MGVEKRAAGVAQLHNRSSSKKQAIMTDSPGAPPTVLVTGGCGFIGSHTVTCLLQTNYNVVVLDNLSNSSTVSLDRVAEIVGLDDESRKERLVFHEVDCCDEKALRKVFEMSPTFVGCIHFAGFKAVGESTKLPIMYFDNNLTSTFVLLRLMDEFNCHSIVFSSSATVYGDPESVPITESSPVGRTITNSYGRTKYFIEEILKDFYNSKKLQDAKEGEGEDWSVVILRYFNPVGAHPTGLIGEDPNGIPNNLMPYVAQVAIGRREYLTVFGDDYDTPDGTGVRDYVHIMDLAEGHLSAIQYMDKKGKGKISTFNLGTGTGLSVLDMVKGMEKACGHEVKYKIGERRSGDLGTVYAGTTLAKEEMGWEAKLGLDDMCKDLWKFQKMNPQGYNAGAK